MTVAKADHLFTGRGAKRLLAVAGTALIASASLSTPSWAAVQPGNNISVFHELDIVSASGYNVGDQLTFQVIRNGVVIGTTSGPAVSGPEGVGLEVNHEGTGADDGSCWSGVTPDILPGDEIVVQSPDGTGIDSTTVLDVSILEGPFEAEADDPTAGIQAGDIVLEGVAADENGNQLPLAQLALGVRDRSVDDFRANPSSLQYIDDSTEWRAIYRAPYNVDRNDGGLTPAEQKQAILNPSVGHEFAWESPDLTVGMISEGPNAGGPGVGCTNAPKAAFGVTSFDDDAVNLGSEDLTVGGTVMNSADVATNSAAISLSDGTNSISQDATINGTTWTATFPRDQIDTLADGTLTASGAYNAVGGAEPLSGAVKEIQKDVVAPGSATATPPAGIYNAVQSVSLNAEGGADIRYTTNGNDPAANSSLYNGQLQVSSSQQIKARAFDKAGNSSEVATFDYTIDRVAPGLSASLDSGIFNSPQRLTLTSGDASAKIYYTTNGDEPEAGDRLYTSPIAINSSQLIKAVAIDEAGNRSRVLERDIVIEAQSALNLNTSASTLTFGQRAVLSGKLTSDGKPLAGKRVILEHRPIGAQKFTRAPGQPAAGVLTAANGNYRVAGVKPNKNTLYRARFVGAPEIKQSLSVTKRVNVKSVVTNATSTKQMKVNQNRVISGIVRPAHTGAVKVQIKQGAKVVATRNVKLSGSRYQMVYKPKAPGVYAVQATMPRHADHLQGVSPIKKFKVIR